MAISGHKTRAIFDRYNIANESDLARAIESATNYHRERADEPAKVVRIRGPALKFVRAISSDVFSIHCLPLSKSCEKAVRRAGFRSHCTLPELNVFESVRTHFRRNRCP